MFDFCIKTDHHLGSCIEKQIDACNGLLINNIEIEDGIDGENLSTMPGLKLESIRNLLIRNNKKIVLLDCRFTTCDMERVNLLFRKARMLGVENINTTSMDFNGAEGTSMLESFLSGALPIARSYGIGLTVENKRSSFLSYEEFISALFSRFKDFQPGFVFNPLEFAAEKKHPFFNVFYGSRLKPSIRFLRVNDGLFADGSPALPGEGNAEIKELTSALLARSFRGYFSFHPYLPGMDVKRYVEVINRFKALLMAM